MKKSKLIAVACLVLSQLFSMMPVDAAKAKVRVKSRPTRWHDSINVPHRSWVPVERPREVLLCVHGLGFSSESFSEFGHSMAGRGMAVYAVDVRGFSQWLDNRST